MHRRPARTRRAWAVVALLLVLVAPPLSCSRESGGGMERLDAPALRTTDAIAARRALEHFLGALAAGRFEEAAADYSGDLKLLRDLSWAVAPDDVSELLQHYCRRHRGACQPYRLVEGRAAGTGLYEFVTEFLDGDGTPLVFGDPMLPQSRTPRVVFRVQHIGLRYYVLDLPPRRT